MSGFALPRVGSSDEVQGMLFHNRPVKAAMGSVIANGGVQLSDGKSLVKTKLATLHFGGVNEMS